MIDTKLYVSNYYSAGVKRKLTTLYVQGDAYITTNRGTGVRIEDGHVHINNADSPYDEANVRFSDKELKVWEKIVASSDDEKDVLTLKDLAFMNNLDLGLDDSFEIDKSNLDSGEVVIYKKGKNNKTVFLKIALQTPEQAKEQAKENTNDISSHKIIMEIDSNHWYKPNKTKTIEVEDGVIIIENNTEYVYKKGCWHKDGKPCKNVFGFKTTPKIYVSSNNAKIYDAINDNDDSDILTIKDIELAETLYKRGTLKHDVKKYGVNHIQGNSATIGGYYLSVSNVQDVFSIARLPQNKR